MPQWVLRRPAERAVGHLPDEYPLVEEPVEWYAGLERALQHPTLVGYRDVHTQHGGIELRRQHAQQRFLGQRAGAKQDRAEASACGALQLQRLLDILRVHNFCVDQEFADSSVFHALFWLPGKAWG